MKRIIYISAPFQFIIVLFIPFLLKSSPPCKAFSPISKTPQFSLKQKQKYTKISARRDIRTIYPKEEEQQPVGQKIPSNEESARQKRTGQAKQRLQKSVRREERIYALEGLDSSMLSEAEVAELKGLVNQRSRFIEQYNALDFSQEHIDFKTKHNNAFIALINYCSEPREKGTKNIPVNLFYLDGPDGGTTSALIDRGGFDATQCFIANRHESSCNILKMSFGGRLPDTNVVHATAEEALTVASLLSYNNTEGTAAFNKSVGKVEGGAFSKIDFTAYYFDGCGGFVPHIINMISAALLRHDDEDYTTFEKVKPISVGYSLTGGSKDSIRKEMAISQALCIIARRRRMRMIHVLDDPARYGISLDISKVCDLSSSGGGYTFTTWLLLEPE